MIIFTQNTLEEVLRLHNLEGSRHNPTIKSIISLTTLLNTSVIGEGGVNKSRIYWEFLHAILENIRTGSWISFPNMWTEIYRMNDADNLSIQQAKDEETAYRQHREELLKDLGIGCSPIQERRLMLKWIKNTYGFLDMLKVSYALANMHIITTSVPVVTDYFNRSDQD